MKKNQLRSAFLSMHANLAFEDFERKHKVNIPEASQNNLRALYVELKPLSAQEQTLFDLVCDNLIYSHGTSCLESIEEAQELSSVKTRQRQEAFTGNRHTGAASGTDRNVFCTAEVDVNDPAPPSFLGEAIDFIRISPKRYREAHGPSEVDNAWTSPHLSEFDLETKHRAGFGDTTYEMKHHINQTKTSRYTFSNGHTTEYNTTLGDEIFLGKDLHPGIALLLIRHLRRLKNEYADSFLERINNPDTELNDKLELLYQVMQHTWPSQMFPEIKIPGKVSVTNGIEIIKQKEERLTKADTDFRALFTKDHFREKSDYFYIINDLIRTNNLEEIKNYPNIEKIIAAMEADGNSPINIANDSLKIKDEHFPMMELLLTLGAALRHTPYPNSHLQQAIDDKDHKWLEWLLQQKFPNPLDPELTSYFQLNQTYNLSRSNPVTDACYLNDTKALQILEKHGADLSRFFFTAYWTNLAASKNFTKAAAYFINNGHLKPSCGPLEFHPLVTFASCGNLDGVKLMLEAGFDPNARHAHKGSHKYGNTALHAAAEAKSFEVLQYLLDLNLIHINTKNASGETALSIAANKSFREGYNLLVEKGADIETVMLGRPQINSFKVSAVAIVTGTVNDERVVILGKKNATQGVVNEFLFPGGIVDHTDRDAIWAAAREFDEETSFPLPALLQQELATATVAYDYKGLAEKTCYITTFIHFECGEALETLLERHRLRAEDDLGEVKVVSIENLRRTGPGIYGQRTFNINKTPLKTSNGVILEAIKQGQTPDPKQLKPICDIEHFGKTLAVQAVTDNETEELKRLIACGVNLYFYYAIKNMLTKNLMQLKLPEATLWGHACMKGSPEILELLASHYQQGRHNVGSPHPVALLVQYNKNPIEKLETINNLDLLDDKSCLAGLYQVIKTGNDELAFFFLEHAPGIVNAILPGYDHPLTEATKHKREALAKHLVNMGAKINPEDAGQIVGAVRLESPLFAAISADQAELVQFYIEQGADVNQLTEQTPKDKAEQRIQRYALLTAKIIQDPFQSAMHWEEVDLPAKYTPLVSAIYHNSDDIVKLLLQHPEVNKTLAAELIVEYRKTPGSLFGLQSEYSRQVMLDLVQEHKITSALNTLQQQRHKQTLRAAVGLFKANMEEARWENEIEFELPSSWICCSQQ